jgi:siroheme synthase (precorrin-2 oxidase/ferrochelatase)
MSQEFATADMCNPTSRPERVAVVGGGGYVGWHIVKRLLQNGHSVAVMDLGLMPEAKKFVEDRGTSQSAITFFRVSTVILFFLIVKKTSLKCSFFCIKDHQLRKAFPNLLKAIKLTCRPNSADFVG